MVFAASPLVSSFNKSIRPVMLDTEETASLPTVVLIGDQSSGKSSVLESLTGISLPHGVQFPTRVPLKIMLQHHADQHVPEFVLEYLDEKITIVYESKIWKAINKATVKIAGKGNGIANIPLTLVVKQKKLPNITMVDLPGIPTNDHIPAQISDMIMEYIKPEDSIILNVLPATADFTTNRSIRISQDVDSTGKRTFTVVTKCDEDPDKVVSHLLIADNIHYTFVRNQINDETYADARAEESKLFTTHHMLSILCSYRAGIPVLAEKLVEKLGDIYWKVQMAEYSAEYSNGSENVSTSI